ncbi:MAG: agmatinase [Deltaproteobacteria bacterium]|nr:agmatinase [Candidatus Zymogenaceae bacterium]
MKNILEDSLLAGSTAQVTILGLPSDKYSSFLRGAADGPPAIREVLFSPGGNLWTEGGVDLEADGNLSDLGDVEFTDNMDHFERIEASVKLLTTLGKRPIFLGGDHYITWPIIKTFSRSHPNLTILQFDAHPDLYDEFDGKKDSHATPFARIMEKRHVRRLIQVGLRGITGHLREQARRFGVDTFEMRYLSEKPDLRLSGDVYISFDLDVLDPAHAPGVSHHEAGGMTVRHALSIIQSIDSKRSPVVGADVVELNPSRDISGITAAAAAKIVKEIAGKMLESIKK